MFASWGTGFPFSPTSSPGGGSGKHHDKSNVHHRHEQQAGAVCYLCTPAWQVPHPTGEYDLACTLHPGPQEDTACPQSFLSHSVATLQPQSFLFVQTSSLLPLPASSTFLLSLSSFPFFLPYPFFSVFSSIPSFMFSSPSPLPLSCFPLYLPP